MADEGDGAGLDDAGMGRCETRSRDGAVSGEEPFLAKSSLINSITKPPRRMCNAFRVSPPHMVMYTDAHCSHRTYRVGVYVAMGRHDYGLRDSRGETG